MDTAYLADYEDDGAGSAVDSTRASKRRSSKSGKRSKKQRTEDGFVPRASRSVSPTRQRSRLDAAAAGPSASAAGGSAAAAAAAAAAGSGSARKAHKSKSHKSEKSRKSHKSEKSEKSRKSEKSIKSTKSTKSTTKSGKSGKSGKSDGKSKKSGKSGKARAPSMASSSSGSLSSSSSSSSSSERDSAYRRFLREVPDMWPETEKNRRNHHADAALWEMLGQVDPRLDLPRIDYQKVGVREFHDEFIRPQRPVIIRGAMDDWKAMRRWRVDGVSRRYRDAKFHLRDNKNGPADYVTLPNLVRYSRENRHDDPMYLFDSHFAKAKATKGMLKDFRVPRYFREDLVAIIPEKHRESYRWILCGGQRSGSAIHTDPLGTSAWNALISGHKRWFLLPPHYTADQVGVKGFGSRHPPANWWKDLYPEKRKLKGAVECIQGPGEIIYVPGGWWHIVINLDVTFCVTQNFVSPNKASFDPAWAVTAKKRPRKARRWRKLLRSHFPEWADRIHKLKYRYASSSEGSSSCGSSGWTSIDELPTTDTDRDGPNASRRAASDSEASSISSSSSSDSSSSDDDSST